MSDVAFDVMAEVYDDYINALLEIDPRELTEEEVTAINAHFEAEQRLEATVDDGEETTVPDDDIEEATDLEVMVDDVEAIEWAYLDDIDDDDRLQFPMFVA